MPEPIIDPEAENKRRLSRRFVLKEQFRTIFASVVIASITVAIPAIVNNFWIIRAHEIRLNTLELRATEDRTNSRQSLDAVNAAIIRIGDKQQTILELLVQLKQK